MGSTRFRNPQALSSALASLGTLQPRAFGFLNCVDPLVSASNLYEDFDSRFFKANWYRCYDKLGNGCEIDFPVRLHSKISWSALVYDKLPDGQLQPKSRNYQEFVVVTLVKKRC